MEEFLEIYASIAQLTAIVIASGILTANVTKDAFETKDAKAKVPGAILEVATQKLRFEQPTADRARRHCENCIWIVKFVTFLVIVYLTIGMILSVGAERSVDGNNTIRYASDLFRYYAPHTYVFLTTTLGICGWLLVDSIGKLTKCRQASILN